MDFSTITLEQIQQLVFPLVETLFGLDVDGWIGEKSILFKRVGDGFEEIADLFNILGTALEDGLLTVEEIEEIIAEAKDIPEAVDVLLAVFNQQVDDEETLG